MGKMAFAENKNLFELKVSLEGKVICKDSGVLLSTSHAESHNSKASEELSMEEQIRNLYQMSGLSPNQMEILTFLTLFVAGTKVFAKVFYWCGFSANDIQWLLRRGWIKREEDCYSMHPIVKSSIELQNENRGYTFDINEYQNMISELINTGQYLPLDLEYSKYKERAVIPKRICTILNNEVFLDINTLQLTLFLMLSVSELFQKRDGDYPNTFACLYNALRISRSIYGEISEPTAGIYYRIAGLYFDNFEYENALEYLKKDFLISVKLDSNDLGMAHTYNLLGETYGKLEKYSVSKYYFLKTLSILSKETLDPEEKEIREIAKAHTYDNFANMYNDRGRYEKALLYHLKALSIYEIYLDEEDPEIATSYNNIALTYLNLGNLSEAQYYYEKSLSIRIKILGDSHPYLIGTYLGLRNVYIAQDNKDALQRIEQELKEKCHFDI